jgi:hypothetical protein
MILPSPERVALDAAFRQTTYRVHAPSGTIDLRIGQVPVALPPSSWAFLTAYNPLPRNLDEAENQRRQAQLHAQLTAQGWIFYPGEGIGDEGTWPPEPSFLVIGITRTQATELAAAHDQLSFVFGTPGCPAELVWTQDAITHNWANLLRGTLL